MMKPHSIRSERLTLVYVPNPRPADGHGASGFFNIGFDGDFAGFVSLVGSPPLEAVVGYDIKPRFRRLGVATEAVQALIAQASGFGLAGLQAQCRSDNLASRRVLEKSGFELISSLPFRVDGADSPIRHMIYRCVLARPALSAKPTSHDCAKIPESIAS